MIKEQILGYPITFTINDGMTEIEYPSSVVTENDAVEFMAFESEERPADAALVTYSTDSGKTTLYYSSDIPRETICSYVPLLTADIEEFISIKYPAIPEKPAISISEQSIDIPSAPIVAKPEQEIIPTRPQVSDPGIILVVEPETTVPETTVPETTVPETTVPETTVPETTVPETTVPETTVPETTVPETTVPETTAPETTAPETTAPAITGRDVEPQFIFDLGLKGRAYADNKSVSAISPALELAFYYNGFSAALNLDPIHLAGIKDLIDNSDTDPFDWVAWGTDFIEYINYRSLDERVSLNIDRVSYLRGDSLGLYSGLDHNWDDNIRPLSFEHVFDSTYYSHRIWFDDLSFRTDDVWSTGGLSFTFGFDENYPASITLEGLTRINRKDIKQTEFYPELSFFIPFYASGRDYIGLNAGIATAFLGEWNVNPFTQNGSLGLVSIPMGFGDFYGELGVAFSQGEVHYGKTGNDIYSPASGQYLTFFGSLGYNSSIFGVGARGWLDVDMNTFAYQYQNSFIEAYAYFNIMNITLFGGIQAAYINETIDYSPSFYAGFSAAAGPVDAYFKAMYDMNPTNYNERRWSFTLGGRISALGVGRETTESYEKQVVGFNLDTQFRYNFDNNSTVFDLMPSFRIGDENLGVTFRAPLQLAFKNDGTVYLAGFNGHDLYDFGSGLSGEEKVWAIYSDAMAIFESLNIGREGGVGYLTMDRNYSRTSTLFYDYGTDDALAFRAGSHFPFLDIALYVDNAETPHLGEFAITILPEGPVAIKLGTTANFLYESNSSYSVDFHPEFRIDVPISDFSISAFVLGSAGLNMNNGAYSSYIIYDKEAGEAYSWMAGAEAAYRGGFFDIILTAGYRTGSLNYGMYDAIGAFWNDAYADSVSGENGSWFGRAEIGTSVGGFFFRASYYVSDLVAIATDAQTGTYSDLFAASIGVSLDTADIYAKFARREFVPSFFKETSFFDYMKASLFSIGADVRYGNVSFNVELGMTMDNTTNDYMNIPSPSGNDSPQFQLKLGTRFEF